LVTFCEYCESKVITHIAELTLDDLREFLFYWNPLDNLRVGYMTCKVTVELDEAESRFMWNMTATVEIGFD
jgi:hypothetical protein